MIDPQIDGKVAIITGTNHGVGVATARALASQGAKVFITYYLPDCPYAEEELEEARQLGIGGDRLYRAMQQQSGTAISNAIRSEGGTAIAHELDLGQVPNIAKLFDLCEQKLGPVDILISNHTHCVLETFDPASVQDDTILTNAQSIDRHFAVNARACSLLMREYLQRHLVREAQWGRIINLTTALRHSRNVSYAASKRALVSYSMPLQERWENTESQSTLFARDPHRQDTFLQTVKPSSQLAHRWAGWDVLRMWPTSFHSWYQNRPVG